jgi:hypothetical protein
MLFKINAVSFSRHSDLYSYSIFLKLLCEFFYF